MVVGSSNHSTAQDAAPGAPLAFPCPSPDPCPGELPSTAALHGPLLGTPWLCSVHCPLSWRGGSRAAAPPGRRAGLHHGGISVKAQEPQEPQWEPRGVRAPAAPHSAHRSPRDPSTTHGDRRGFSVPSRGHSSMSPNTTPSGLLLLCWVFLALITGYVLIVHLCFQTTKCVREQRAISNYELSLSFLSLKLLQVSTYIRLNSSSNKLF